MSVPVTTFDAADAAMVREAAARLLDAEIRDEAAHEAWLLERSEFDAVCSEARANLYIAMTCATDDEACSRAWEAYIKGVQPELQRIGFELDRKQAASREALGAGGERFEVLDRDTAADVAIFRQENVPLHTQIATLDQRYNTLCGAQACDFDGEERTFSQMGAYLQKADRGLRERAWRGVAQRRLQDADQIDGIFAQMVALRAKVAHNAGLEDYRAYAFKEKKRFDYTPEDCSRFHQGVEAHVVPLVRELDADRARAMGVERLRPWDLDADPLARPALAPFKTAEELTELCGKVFDQLDPELGAMYGTMTGGGCLDLASRKGKAPGGYQYMRDASRTPFIFMNAAGLQSDVRVLLHEAGHAFHSILCKGEPLLHYRHSPIEFAEVASMTMELLTMPHWDVFYGDPVDADRARRQQLETISALLCQIATIDALQHRVYTLGPGDAQGRKAAWRDLAARFGRGADWTGLEHYQERLWQRQGHLFGVPFYYIEYGIAQLGALRLWGIAQRQGVGVVLAMYKRALAMGGSRPLPELFAAAGIDLDFSPGAIAQAAGELRAAIDGLPA